MLHTIEVDIDTHGVIHPLQSMPPTRERRALLTVVVPDQAITAPAYGDWREFVGALSDSPNFNDDAALLQRKLRDEWR